MPETTVDFGAVTGRQQATWSSGDFHVIGRQVVPVNEATVEAADPRAGSRVLDVACGSGSGAIAAARRYCVASGIDYVPGLIERAKKRAEADGVDIDFRVADAQALPYDTATFDAVVSTFGVMFAPDQEKAAKELARVTKPGGTIALATWRPEGYGGAFFGPHARAVPPPPGVKPALRWGTKEGLDELLGPWTKDLRTEVKTVPFFFHSVDHMIDELEKWFGPSNRVVETVDAATRATFEKELRETIEKFNQAKDGTVRVVADYLQVVATRNDRAV